MDILQFWEHPPRARLGVVMPRAARRKGKPYNHAHLFHEVGFVIEGACDWVIDGRRERLRAGDLLVVPAGARHQEETSGEERARLGWVGFDFADGHADVPPALTTPLATREYETDIRRLFETFCTERQTQPANHSVRTELVLRELLIILCRLRPAGAHGKSRASVKKALMESAAHTLVGDLSQPMRIRDLAHYHSLSPSHFALLFHRHRGETPQRYLHRMRIERASALLKAGELNVKEIAAACGYADAAHLCHAFKSATKLTPRQFRLRQIARPESHTPTRSE